MRQNKLTGKLPTKYQILIKIKWIIVLLLLSAVIYGSYTLNQYVSGNQVKGEEKTEVILDAGHGGDDPGNPAPAESAPAAPGGQSGLSDGGLCLRRP